MYPSGDSPQATATNSLLGDPFKCIRAAIPHKPQRPHNVENVWRSVSERRFPTSHSTRKPQHTTAISVSERRFPTSHSKRGATMRPVQVYPSGDSPQATAKVRLCATQAQCIRAAIPHKPQLPQIVTAIRFECIRAAIPHKPQRRFCFRRLAASVSERRFPTSHSINLRSGKDVLVYPSGDSPQATAFSRITCSRF